MTREEEQRQLTRLRKDKLFRQWSPVLNRQARQGGMAAVEVWIEAERAIRRLRDIPADERDAEMEYIYTDVLGKCQREGAAKCVIAVLYTMLVDAGESAEKANENPYAACCRAILAMLLGDSMFEMLIEEFFARTIDNNMQNVVLPVTDYLALVGEEEETLHAAPASNAPDAANEAYRLAIQQPAIGDATPYIQLLTQVGRKDLTDAVYEHFRNLEQHRHYTHIETNHGPVNGSVGEQKFLLGNQDNNLLLENK